MDYKVVLTARAETDLFALVLFIAQKNPAAAEKTGLSLLNAAEALCFLPFRGAAMKGRLGLRRLPHRPHYLIVYRINDSARLVEIVRFWDARQNPNHMRVS